MSADDFSHYQTCKLESKFREADWERASARHDIAKMHERMAMLISQHEPLKDFAYDRNDMKVIFRYIRHGDINRLNRELKGEMT